MAEPKTFAIKPKRWQPPPADWYPKTLGEEVEALVAEWYGTRGLSIPAEERGIGAVIDRMERERFAEEMRLAGGMEAAFEEAKAAAKAPPPADETLEEKAARLAAAVGPKPAEFGTKEFWSWAARKRAADNAALAAKGLPPLPTAKEKAAAKEAAAAERAAKKAAKAK
jgi:hypothetical protein